MKQKCSYMKLEEYTVKKGLFFTSDCDVFMLFRIMERKLVLLRQFQCSDCNNNYTVMRHSQ